MLNTLGRKKIKNSPLSSLVAQLFTKSSSSLHAHISTSLAALTNFLTGTSLPPLHLGFSAKCLNLVFTTLEPSSSSSLTNSTTSASACPEAQLLTTFVKDLSSGSSPFRRFDAEVLPHYLRLLGGVESRPADRDRLLASFIDLLKHRHPDVFDVNASSSLSTASSAGAYDTPMDELEVYLTSILSEGDWTEVSLGLQWAAIVILPFLKLRQKEKVEEALETAIKFYFQGLVKRFVGFYRMTMQSFQNDCNYHP